MHIHTCTHIHTHVHTHTNTYTHTYTHMYTYTHKHIYIHTNTHIHTQTHIYIHTYIYIQKHPYTHTHMYTHTYVTVGKCIHCRGKCCITIVLLALFQGLSHLVMMPVLEVLTNRLGFQRVTVLEHNPVIRKKG